MVSQTGILTPRCVARFAARTAFEGDAEFIDTLRRRERECSPLPMLRTGAKYKNSAAFYDVDGTLIKINIVHAFAFYASRQPSMLESAKRTVKTAAAVPIFWA